MMKFKTRSFVNNRANFWILPFINICLLPNCFAAAAKGEENSTTNSSEPYIEPTPVFVRDLPSSSYKMGFLRKTDHDYWQEGSGRGRREFSLEDFLVWLPSGDGPTERWNPYSSNYDWRERETVTVYVTSTKYQTIVMPPYIVAAPTKDNLPTYTTTVNYLGKDISSSLNTEVVHECRVYHVVKHRRAENPDNIYGKNQSSKEHESGKWDTKESFASPTEGNRWRSTPAINVEAYSTRDIPVTITRRASSSSYDSSDLVRSSMEYLGPSSSLPMPYTYFLSPTIQTEQSKPSLGVTIYISSYYDMRSFENEITNTQNHSPVSASSMPIITPTQTFPISSTNSSSFTKSVDIFKDTDSDESINKHKAESPSISSGSKHIPRTYYNKSKTLIARDKETSNFELSSLSASITPTTFKDFYTTVGSTSPPSKLLPTLSTLVGTIDEDFMGEIFSSSSINASSAVLNDRVKTVTPEIINIPQFLTTEGNFKHTNWSSNLPIASSDKVVTDFVTSSFATLEPFFTPSLTSKPKETDGQVSSVFPFSTPITSVLTNDMGPSILKGSTSDISDTSDQLNIATPRFSSKTKVIDIHSSEVKTKAIASTSERKNPEILSSKNGDVSSTITSISFSDSSTGLNEPITTIDIGYSTHIKPTIASPITTADSLFPTTINISSLTTENSQEADSYTSVDETEIELESISTNTQKLDEAFTETPNILKFTTSSVDGETKEEPSPYNTTNTAKETNKTDTDQDQSTEFLEFFFTSSPTLPSFSVTPSLPAVALEKKYWIRSTIIGFLDDEDENKFKSEMKNKLRTAYTFARRLPLLSNNETNQEQRKDHNLDGRRVRRNSLLGRADRVRKIKSTDSRRRKRYSEPDIDVYMLDIILTNNTNLTDLIYSIFEDQSPVLASRAVEILDAVNDTEMETFIGYPLAVKAEEYLQTPKMNGVADRRKYDKLFALIIGASSLSILIITLAVSFIAYKRCKKVSSRDSSGELQEGSEISYPQTPVEASPARENLAFIGTENEETTPEKATSPHLSPPGRLDPPTMISLQLPTPRPPPTSSITMVRERQGIPGFRGQADYASLEGREKETSGKMTEMEEPLYSIPKPTSQRQANIHTALQHSNYHLPKHFLEEVGFIPGTSLPKFLPPPRPQFPLFSSPEHRSPLTQGPSRSHSLDEQQWLRENGENPEVLPSQVQEAVDLEGSVQATSRASSEVEISSETPQGGVGIGRLRKRFHELLDDAFSLLNGQKPSDRVTQLGAPYQFRRMHSAMPKARSTLESLGDGDQAFARARRLIRSSKRPWSAAPAFRSSSETTIHTRENLETSPRSAWIEHRRSITPVNFPHLYLESRSDSEPLGGSSSRGRRSPPTPVDSETGLKVSDPAVPLIKAIKEELHRFKSSINTDTADA